MPVPIIAVNDDNTLNINARLNDRPDASRMAKSPANRNRNLNDDYLLNVQLIWIILYGFFLFSIHIQKQKIDVI